MNGSDKILSRIQSDCDKSVKEAQAQAKRECDDIIAEAQLTADKNAAEIAEKAKQKRAQLQASAKSRAQLETRNALLKRRRTEIDKTIAELNAYLLGLDDKTYFEAIYRLAAQLKGKSGEVLMNAKDLTRLPSDFEERLKAVGLDAQVSQTPVNIGGGFVLKSGDIEENMDFAAIISAKRDDIEDLINRELFAE